MSQRPSSVGFRFQLDLHSGVPVYRQIIDQVRGGIASGLLAAGHQLPTVRHLRWIWPSIQTPWSALIANSNLAGCLETHQGTGTFISAQKMKRADAERERQLAQIVADCVSRAGAAGFTVEELIEELRGMRHRADPQEVKDMAKIEVAPHEQSRQSRRSSSARSPGAL